MGGGAPSLPRLARCGLRASRILAPICSWCSLAMIAWLGLGLG